jgi:PAS domain S-box-containing protein
MAGAGEYFGSILIIDDEVLVASDIAKMLRREHFDVIGHYATADEGYAAIIEHNPDAVLIDIMLNDGADGIDLASKICAAKDIPIVFLTCLDDEATLHRAKETMPAGFLTKPVRKTDLVSTLTIAIYNHRLRTNFEKSEKRQLRFREKIFQAMGQPVLILDSSQTILDANNEIVVLTGMEKESLVGKKCYDIFHNGIPDQPCCPFFKLMDNEKYEPAEMEVQSLGKTFLVTCTPVWDESGKLDSIIHVSVDITKRKREEALLQRLTAIVEHTSDLISTSTPDRNINYLNRAGYELLRIPYTTDIQTLTIEDLHPAWAYQIIEKIGLPAAIKDGVWRGETAVRAFDGREIPVSQVIMAHRTFDGKLIYFSTIMRDISDRLKAERLLRESEEKLRNIIEHSTNAFYTHGTNHVITYISPQFQDITGYSPEEAMRKWTEFITDHPMNREGFALTEEAIRTGKRQRPYELELLHKNGKKVYVEVHEAPVVRDGKTIMIVGALTDITERRRIEEMMLQNEKMMTIGSLAAGMAHEINNPLGIILQGVQATLMKLSPEYEKNKELAAEVGIDLLRLQEYLEKSEIGQYLAGIREAGIRAADIVSGMLQFSRRSSGMKRPVKFHELIEKSIDLASKDYDLKKKYDFKNIEIVRQFDPELQEVHCIRNEMEQVILNLLKNSAQALHEMAGGGFQPKIEISTKKESADAVLMIKDNGPGIDEYSRKHLFEPFYTTKLPGEGTGLGLAVVFFIIYKNHGGSISVESDVGQGTRFIMRLPLGGE